MTGVQGYLLLIWAMSSVSDITMNRMVASEPAVSEATKRTMSANRCKNTSIELAVRKALRSAGLTGYRLHWEKAPGKPDIAFPGRKLAIFVNGCFWHRHEGCKYSYTPKTRVDFWNKKFEDNIRRDKHNYEELESQRWTVIIIWECEFSSNRITSVIEQLKAAMNGS